MPGSTLSQIHMSYSELVVVSDSIHSFMVRDAAEFTNYGVLPAATTAFKAKIDVFADLPIDIEFLAVLIDLTAAKNFIASQLRVTLREIGERARMCFGTDTGKYIMFHNKDLSKLSDGELLTFSRLVKRSADTFHTELLVYGLTALMITDLDTKNADFELALSAQRFQIAARDAATKDRAEKALELYGLLTSYCETGKTIWYETNEAYYNDYVLFGPSGVLLTLVPPIDFNYIQSFQKFEWTALTNATSYEIEMSSDGTNWTVLYTGTASEYAYVPTGGGSIEFRCRGRNSGGYGPYCDPISVLYVEPLPAPATVTVTADYSIPPNVYLDVYWDAVPGAEFYKVYECWVPFGAPEGVFNNLGNFNLTNVRRLVTRNRRYYYKVKAATSTTESADSVTVYIDVPA